MNLRANDEQDLLRDSIERFARDHAGEGSKELLSGLAGLGVLALPVPETAGGLGGSGAELAKMMQAVGRCLLPVPLAGTLAALDLLGRHGTQPQQERWLAPAVDGAQGLVLAQLERGCLDGDRITGSAALVPGAGIEGTALVVVTGGRAAIVERDASGLVATPIRMADGVMGARIELDAVASEPLDADTDQLSDCMSRAKAATAAQILGIMERLLEETLDYVKTRQQFGVAIGSFQTIQHRMARLFVATEMCRSLVMAAADGSGPRLEWQRRVAAAQALTAEYGLHLAHECVQFHGGMGITDLLATSLGHRQILVLARQFGSEIEARREFDRTAAG